MNMIKNLAIVGGIAYASYWAYNHYILPRQKKHVPAYERM